MQKFFKLIVALLIPQIIGGIGAIFTVSAIPSWYSTLNKPFLNPPNYIFGPVWTILYLMMGISFFLIWQKGFAKKTGGFFMIQLFLNGIWSFLFFGLQSPLLALIDIILLIIFLALTIFYFFQNNRLASFLLIPYFLWITFASYLNLMIYILN
ncbi:MAG TPA: tryptophan-rich sensory protein [Candidatus Gracilibacteria bacterium]|nr:tryptophan-rich sensory protein [Candidatus Gracilibacteria bacterium]